MAAKKKAAKKVEVEETSTINTSNMIPSASIEKPVIENKISKADIINIITQGVRNSTRKELDAAREKVVETENELNVTLKNKIIARLKKEINNPAIEIDKTNTILNNKNNIYVDFKIKVNDKLEFNNACYVDLTEEESEEYIALRKNINLAMDNERRIQRLMETACSKDAIKAQIDSAVIAKTPDGDKFMENINDHIAKLANHINTEAKQIAG